MGRGGVGTLSSDFYGGVMDLRVIGLRGVPLSRSEVTEVSITLFPLLIPPDFAVYHSYITIPHPCSTTVVPGCPSLPSCLTWDVGMCRLP